MHDYKYATSKSCKTTLFHKALTNVEFISKYKPPFTLIKATAVIN